MTPIVLVPGLLCTAEVFAPQIPALWPYGPVTVASTLEGETLPEIAASILESAPPSFALAGISMGGYICLEIMRQAPERIVKLALLDTSARPDTPEQITNRRALVAQARSGDFAAILRQAFGYILHPSRRDDTVILDICVRMGLGIGVEKFARHTEAVIGRPDSRPDLSGISVPTLVLAGDSDPLTPPDCSQEMVAAIPNSRLVIVPECGHSSTLERPGEINDALAGWIRD